MTGDQVHFRGLERMYLGAPNNDSYRPTISVGGGTAEIRIEVVPESFHAAGADQRLRERTIDDREVRR
ncbi:MAG: hypothetical protein PVG53_10250 [Holophagae bacterium]|jgi:hypothetical protein